MSEGTEAMGNNTGATTDRATAGPWDYAPDYDAKGWSIGAFQRHSNLTRIIATVPFEDDQANARLIAAAPDLLSAAQKALAGLSDLMLTAKYVPGVGQTFNALRAAIERATGGES